MTLSRGVTAPDWRTTAGATSWTSEASWTWETASRAAKGSRRAGGRARGYLRMREERLIVLITEKLDGEGGEIQGSGGAPATDARAGDVPVPGPLVGPRQGWGPGASLSSARCRRRR